MLENNEKPEPAEFDRQSAKRNELPVDVSELDDNAHSETHELPVAAIPIIANLSSIILKPLNKSA
jgi:hypothetical protein